MRRKKNGYVLIATAAGAIVLVGMLGMAVDLGRLYIARNEAQSFTDAAALRAVMKLNGKNSGITNATSAAAAAASFTQSSTTYVTNGWNMGTTSFSGNYTLKFGTSATGTFVAAGSVPSPPTNYGFVEVVATPSLPLTFIRMVGAPSSQQVAARSVAGLVLATFPAGGYMPFTPFARATNGTGAGQDPTGNYGFTVGQSYAFLWPGNLSRGNACPGDKLDLNGQNNSGTWDTTWDMSATLAGSDRGYFELQAASAIADAILGAKQTQALSIGDTITLTNGQKQAEQNALEARALRDTDQTEYEDDIAPSCINANNNCAVPAYHGNGQRLIIMPVNSYRQNSTSVVVGFASFLLPMDYNNGGNRPWCAIYMGSSTVGGSDVSPYPTGGAYVARLVQ